MPIVEIHNTSYVLPSGERVLRQEAIIHAPLVDVWRALTTTDGLRSFAAPVVHLDFRIGGKWEASYNPQSQAGDPGNIVNEIISYLPMEMLSIRVVNTPPDFPHPQVVKAIWTVMLFHPVDESHTLLAISMAGWKAGPEWDAIYAFFERGNAYTLEKLYESLSGGGKGIDHK
jgi:uncharacterized protein YndB with AHSA1/START domain